MKKKIKVLTVFGTRPEAVKMAPIVLALEKQSDVFESVVAVTGQHREMLDQVLEIFQIHPDFDLSIMKKGQSLGMITEEILHKLSPVIASVNPDIVLVHGDTSTAFVSGLIAFYHQVKLGHVEAGLRTWDKFAPFPEEMNRQMIDVLADFYFAPTKESKSNLLKENHPDEQIFVTGNTAIDALKETIQSDYHHPLLDEIGHAPFVLMTMHRRENLGEPMKNVFSAVRQVIDRYPDLHVVYPVHLNPVVKQLAEQELGNHDRIHLIEPLDVIDFHNLASRSFFLMTDSGGVQEEAPSLGKPVLVLREVTERPEGVAAGTLKIIGTEQASVAKEMTTLIEDNDLYQSMSKAQNPYGDGQASQRILQVILASFNGTQDYPADFTG